MPKACLAEIKALRRDLVQLLGGAFSRDEAARFLGLSIRTLDTLVANSLLLPVSNGVNSEMQGLVTFRNDELEGHLEQRESKIPVES